MNCFVRFFRGYCWLQQQHTRRPSTSAKRMLYGVGLVVTVGWTMIHNARTITGTAMTTTTTMTTTMVHPRDDPVGGVLLHVVGEEDAPATTTTMATTAMLIQTFWNRAFQLAVVNNSTTLHPTMGTSSRKTKKTQPQQKDDCPKVFVYNLSSAFRDVTHSEIANIEYTFGREIQYNHHDDDDDDDQKTSVSSVSLRETDQYSFGILLEHRLRQPDNCYYTSDPTQADLLFVPVLTRPKISQTMMRTCRRLNSTQLVGELQSQDAQQQHDQEDARSVACRRFFVLSKGHYKGRPCKGWFWDPIPEFQSAMRLAYSHVPAVMGKEPSFFKRATETEAIDKLQQVKHPHLFSVPYPSSLHYLGGDDNGGGGGGGDDHSKASTITTTPRRRKYLMSFVGSFDHGDVPVRRRIRDSCRIYNDTSICKVVTPRHGTNSALDLLVKQDSVFCLEPVGDSPWRKSLSDSIVFGCIPVLFSNETDDVAPWFWGSWKLQGRILLLAGEEDRNAFLEGRIDLYEWLRSIPPPFLQLLQETLAKYGRRFQYSQTDDPHDGIHIALQGMKDYVQRRKRQGLCG